MEIWLLLALVSVLTLYLKNECSSMHWVPSDTVMPQSIPITEWTLLQFYNYITVDQNMRCLNPVNVNLHGEVLTQWRGSLSAPKTLFVEF